MKYSVGHMGNELTIAKLFWQIGPYTRENVNDHTTGMGKRRKHGRPTTPAHHNASLYSDADGVGRRARRVRVGVDGDAVGPPRLLEQAQALQRAGVVHRHDPWRKWTGLIGQSQSKEMPPPPRRDHPQSPSHGCRMKRPLTDRWDSPAGSTLQVYFGSSTPWEFLDDDHFCASCTGDSTTGCANSTKKKQPTPAGRDMPQHSLRPSTFMNLHEKPARPHKNLAAVIADPLLDAIQKRLTVVAMASLRGIQALKEGSA